MKGAASLSMFPGPRCPFTLHFDIDRLVVTYARSREIARVSIDTTSEVRTWRLEVDPGQLSSRILVDGIHVLSLLPPSAADCDLAPGEWGGVSFGEFGTLNGGLAGSQLPPGSLAYFLHSPTYSAPSPAGSTRGSLCLGTAVGRFNRSGELQRASAGGTASLGLDLTSLPLPMGTAEISPGDTWHFQLWYRDTTAAGTGALSSALQVVFHR